MEKIYNAQLKELYINKYKLNDIFTVPIVDTSYIVTKKETALQWEC